MEAVTPHWTVIGAIRLPIPIHIYAASNALAWTPVARFVYRRGLAWNPAPSRQVRSGVIMTARSGGRRDDKPGSKCGRAKPLARSASRRAEWSINDADLQPYPLFCRFLTPKMGEMNRQRASE